MTKSGEVQKHQEGKGCVRSQDKKRNPARLSTTKEHHCKNLLGGDA